ncbi:MAG: MoxR family ATPase [Syntrophomonadaceae bacterium]|nr:MoxR family ATPase [Syntrophomonadaceae bacterium]
MNVVMHDIENILRLRNNLSQVIIGKEEVIELILTALIANGHVLIEDVPGVGKTLLAKTLAKSLACTFKRIQFTPDLTPIDVIGFNIYDQKSNEFVLRAGPVMTNILLADEINRAVPRTQSSLLEAMEERQVTIDGETIDLPRPFLVLATQNPVEQEGTFVLPEAQLDRFLMKIYMGYPSEEEEIQILTSHGSISPLVSLEAVCSIEDVLRWQEMCLNVKVKNDLQNYIVKLVRATREHESILLGASPRAALGMKRAVQALAMLRGRDYVIPDDIKELCKPVLAHRLVLKREERLRGVSVDEVLMDILNSTAVPVEGEE